MTLNLDTGLLVMKGFMKQGQDQVLIGIKIGTLVQLDATNLELSIVRRNFVEVFFLYLIFQCKFTFKYKKYKRHHLAARLYQTYIFVGRERER